MILLILIQFLIIVLLQETLVPSLGFIGSYLIRPLLWLSLVITTLLFAKQKGKNILSLKRVRRWYLGKSPIQGALIIGGFQISILIILGLFTTFGKSPYSFSPMAILFNLFFVISFLLGTELARSYFINTSHITKKQITLVILLTTLLFVIIELPFQNPGILLFENPPKTLEFLGKTFITAITINLLASYLSYLGGATASMSYVGVLLCFQSFSPILPDPHWTLQALIGTIAPAIGFLILQDSLITPRERRLMNRKQRKKRGSDSWTVVAIFSVLIIFFSFGYLGVEPKIVYSGSMYPEYQVGDIVIIDDVNVSSLQEGDVIQYVSFDNKTLILHRIIEINQTEDGQTTYLTKGDANEDPDFRPITEQRILGKPIFTIPKLGWVQIFIRVSLRNLGVPI